MHFTFFSSNQEKTEETAKPSNKPSRKKQIASKSGGGRLKGNALLFILSLAKFLHYDYHLRNLGQTFPLERYGLKKTIFLKKLTVNR